MKVHKSASDLWCAIVLIIPTQYTEKRVGSITKWSWLCRPPPKSNRKSFLVLHALTTAYGTTATMNSRIASSSSHPTSDKAIPCTSPEPIQRLKMSRVPLVAHVPSANGKVRSTRAANCSLPMPMRCCQRCKMCLQKVKRMFALGERNVCLGWKQLKRRLFASKRHLFCVKSRLFNAKRRLFKPFHRIPPYPFTYSRRGFHL